MNKDDLVHEIGQMLIHDPRISRQPWKHLAIVAQVSENSTQVNGFVYDDRLGWTSTAPKDTRVLRKFRGLQDVMGEEEGYFWQACLVRIDKLTGKISIDFEYTQPEKWLINPATLEEMAEKLKPE